MLVRFDCAELPFQIADPQHEIGDGDGAGVDFEAVELAGVDGLALHRQARRVLAQIVQRLKHLAFQALHQFQRDIEEIAGAAGRVEHAGRAERVVEILDRLERAVAVAGVLQLMRVGQRLLPVGTQRLDDRRDDQPFDIAAGRIVGAEFGALPLVQRPFQQRAEDRGLDLAPVSGGSDPEFADLLLLQARSPCGCGTGRR